MSKLYVFGDSYTTPDMCVDPQDSFWGLAGVELGVDQIINASRQINSFDTVCQLLIGMQNEYTYDWENDYFIIGIPPLERITTFFPERVDMPIHTEKATWKDYNAKIYNTATFESFDTVIQAHNSLFSLQFFGGDQQLTIHADRSWLETQVLRELYLLTNWLDSNNAKYLICNLSKPLDEGNWWGPSDVVLNHAIGHTNCILFNKTYYSVNEGIHIPPDADTVPHDPYSGHHGAAGNKLYYEASVRQTMTELGWIL